MGENKNFSSFAEKIMADAGVEVTLVQVMTLPRILILIKYDPGRGLHPDDEELH